MRGELTADWFHVTADRPMAHHIYAAIATRPTRRHAGPQVFLVVQVVLTVLVMSKDRTAFHVTP